VSSCLGTQCLWKLLRFYGERSSERSRPRDPDDGATIMITWILAPHALRNLKVRPEMAGGRPTGTNRNCRLQARSTKVDISVVFAFDPLLTLARRASRAYCGRVPMGVAPW